MEAVASIMKTQIERESVLVSKICPKCNEPLYTTVNLLGVERKMRVMCRCERAAKRKEEEIDIAKEKQKRLERLSTDSLMDEKFKSSTFESWDFSKGDKKMYDLGKRYVKNFKKCKEEGLGLLIYGEPGNGKTYLSSCIANELLNNYVPVICISINGLLDRIQQTYNRYGNEAQSDIIRCLCNADLLVIDDLGTEHEGKGWSRSIIYNIIDSRYRSKLPFIITSNLKINSKEQNGALAERYEKRTEDRIFEMCTPIHNTQNSFRVDEAKKKTELLRDILYKE